MSFNTVIIYKCILQRSATTLQPLSGKVINCGHFFTMQCASGKAWVLEYMWMPLWHTLPTQTTLQIMSNPSWWWHSSTAVKLPWFGLPTCPADDDLGELWGQFNALSFLSHVSGHSCAVFLFWKDTLSCWGGGPAIGECLCHERLISLQRCLDGWCMSSNIQHECQDLSVAVML